MTLLKCSKLGFVFASLISFVSAAPEFIGVLVSQGTTYVALRLEAGEPSRWVKIGDAVGEYRTVAYNSGTESLTLAHGERESVLTLKAAVVQSAPTLALLESLVANGDGGLDEALQGLRRLEARRAKTAAELADWEARMIQDPAAKGRVADLRRQLEIEQSNTEYLLRRLTDEARSRGRK